MCPICTRFDFFKKFCPFSVGDNSITCWSKDCGRAPVSLLHSPSSGMTSLWFSFTADVKIWNRTSLSTQIGIKNFIPFLSIEISLWQFFPSPHILILAHFKWFFKPVFSSDSTHPPQRFPISVTILCDQSCRGTPKSSNPSGFGFLIGIFTSYYWVPPLKIKFDLLPPPLPLYDLFCRVTVCKFESVMNCNWRYKSMGCRDSILESGNNRKWEG